jgi:hypothetical protein
MQWVRAADQQGLDPAAIFLAVGILGDSSSLSWLLQCAAQPAYTLCALDAFRRISGFDALQAVQADRQLVSTLEAAVLEHARQQAQKWLQVHADTFRNNAVYFLGHPISRSHLLEVIRYGYQVDRELAAMRLLNDPKPCLIPVRSNCLVQHRVITAMSS